MKGKIFECCEDCPHFRVRNGKFLCTKGAKQYREGDTFFSDCPKPDLFEAVQCKDCKNYLPHPNDLGVCGIHDYVTASTDFCSFGEKKEGENATNDSTE